MTSPASSPPPGWLGARTTPTQWFALLVLSAALTALLTLAGLPAALLLGPLLAGVAVSASGARLGLPRWTSLPVQGVIGCLIAKMLPVGIAGQIGSHAVLFAVGVVSVIALSSLLGWLLTRLRVLPGTTALWGMSPGAATIMTLLAESYGADARMVAVMQYLRVLMVAAIASVVARFVGADGHHALQQAPWFAAVPALPFALTLVLAFGGAFVGRLLRVSVGPLFVPLVAGLVLEHHGWLTLELPRWLLAVAYALIGWRIGLSFTRALLLHAARALPRIVACTTGLILACCALAALLVVAAGVDPLTAYLATSPGGADSVAIIAASTHVDVPFVMAMQMVRLIAVLLIGPAVSRFLARHAMRREKSGAAARADSPHASSTPGD
ncbi:ammonia monooxygenase [Burkholderia sp. WAC0059]|uniref:AbrB family transcriptional regulator n=1 Tax=Burkholderia sp. WAC0059 TaxID=2066022 RepID=UPI000C7F2290|nr:AbrB family transcriptional regulator [Burkholderia sp. WAC0059]PLZ04275.1 ammonia monooxygenase [Burkholderia sp. WAC0059]